MTRSELIALLEEVTASEPGSIKGDEIVLDLPGWDSLCSAEFMVMLANKWRIEVSGVQVDKCERVSDLAKLVKATDPALGHPKTPIQEPHRNVRK